jgi:hypothetical protein
MVTSIVAKTASATIPRKIHGQGLSRKISMGEVRGRRSRKPECGVHSTEYSVLRTAAGRSAA